MYVRVAFAIAASVEPDILIIDEASRWAMPFFSIVASAG
jgi:ABC-type polysaccharide/polyol phosphate transport system ATPase subunit